jgi:hypothetical protein
MNFFSINNVNINDRIFGYLKNPQKI